MGRNSNIFHPISPSPYLLIYHFGDAAMDSGHRLNALDMRWMEMV
jgi:hypothetical protein